MHLTPRMIQSMEILQMPLNDLEARIESELQANPILEVDRDSARFTGRLNINTSDTGSERHQRSADERPLTINENSAQPAEFRRLERLAGYLENEEFATDQPWRNSRPYHQEGDRDQKLDAMANSPSRGQDLNEQLRHQWALVDCPPNIRAAGLLLINYIDSGGYLRTEFELMRQESKNPPPVEDLEAALKLVQQLEPAGVGARNLQECLLLQIDALEQDPEAFDEHDFDLERALIRNHLEDLKMNRYPQISRALDREISEIKAAVRAMTRLSARPGGLAVVDDAHAITPDATITFNEETGKYEVKMSRESSPHLHLSRLYRKWLKRREGDKTTREFLASNLRNARWLMESIEQRAGTIQRVIKAVVEHQREFFDRGIEFLKPLPMTQVADQLGIHVATVSRAVSEKWVQTPQGVMPLRRFFSGGTTSSEGEDMSWDAVKEKLRVIIGNEDKQNPLNDDEIVEKLQQQGINIARRTVAKYRKILNIASARQRREFA